MKTSLTQKDRLLELFHLYGGKLTLGFLLSHPSGIGYKAVSRMADLRKLGHDIRFSKGKIPSENTYTLIHYDASGQGRLIQ